ncbi:esterase/lipase/thioesterase [Bisporella sp. PMI_857]|nr:esterase/lipase/thioesterase [Bisporella sp. PMI_857]
MPLTSDITVDAAKFHPNAVSEQTTKVNDHLIKLVEGTPKWFELGAAKYREMRKRGETAFPAPTLLPDGLDIEVPSREPGRSISCRLFFPSARKSDNERKKCKGSVLHIHGGGWVLGDHLSADILLQTYADAGDLAVISVGYRLAPEDPFPKGPEDCFDTSEYLIKNSFDEYGGPLRFVGGESAGGHLSLLVAYHLLKNHSEHRLDGLLLHFGCFDLSFTPSATVYTKQLILNNAIMSHFISTFLSATRLDKKHPSVSPYYEDLSPFRGRLPSALFTCGTDDPLLDDTINMGTKWAVSGAESIVKVYPGAAHGFIGFPRDQLPVAGMAVDDTKEYIRDRLGKSPQ